MNIAMALQYAGYVEREDYKVCQFSPGHPEHPSGGVKLYWYRGEPPPSMEQMREWWFSYLRERKISDARKEMQRRLTDAFVLTNPLIQVEISADPTLRARIMQNKRDHEAALVAFEGAVAEAPDEEVEALEPSWPEIDRISDFIRRLLDVPAL